MKGVPAVVLERADAPGSAWRNHYDRLHLHTNNRLSHLPGLRFPRDAGRYPSRQAVVQYLDDYARHHELDIRFGAEVQGVAWERDQWRIEYSGGVVSARHVVVATGLSGAPFRPAWDGLEGFPGPVLHSSEYRNGRPFAGQRVLVVGFGNSGGEITLDLAEHGAHPVISIRNPVNIIPRALFGIPILAIAIPLSFLPPGLADALSAPLLSLTIGNYRSLGMAKRPKGPFRQIAEDGRIPLIDVGTVALLRGGGASVRPEVLRFRGDHVDFADGTSERFDAVVAATGFLPSFHHVLRGADQVVGPHGIPWVSGARTDLPGLFFCGFYLSPTGMLREIGLEARRIARQVAQDRRQAAVR
jgi:cation diffusion facilitator CzcD-associated flavoprotein CzcO